MSVSEILAFAHQHPALQAFAIIFATFILEDAATVLAAVQAASGELSVAVALGSLYVGIVVGDIGLYGLGRLAAYIPWFRRLLPPERTEMLRKWLQGRVFRVVVISRFLPGIRLPTYTTCGYVRADLRKFILGTMIATLFWTSSLFALSMRFGQFIMAHFGVWRWAGFLGLLVGFVLVGWIAGVITRDKFRLPPRRKRTSRRKRPMSKRRYEDAPQQ